MRVVSDINIDPHHAGNTEDVHKIHDQKYRQQAKGNCLAISQKPVEKGDKKQAKPASPNVGDKHGAVVIARFREVVQITFRTALQHIERLHKRPAACFKNFTFMASWAFQMQYTIPLTFFF